MARVEELLRQSEASLFDGAELVEVAGVGRERPVRLQPWRISVAPVGRQDPARVVVRQPAVDDDRGLRRLLVEREIDEHGQLPVLTELLVVGRATKVGLVRDAEPRVRAQHHEVVDAVSRR